MTFSPPFDADDPTVEELEQSGRRLAIVCGACSRFRYMKTHRFDASQKLSKIAEKLICASCSSKDVRAVPVSRDPDTGFWPAERS
ncbi:MAG: hypothetical protein ABJQ71_21615 [Roseibium sp.]